MEIRRGVLYSGYDGRTCFVHARPAAAGDTLLVTAQKMDVTGSDCFDGLQTAFSRDGGKTWTAFSPEPAFASTVADGIRTVCCDMTPLYHKASGRFLVTGHSSQYRVGSVFPLPPHQRMRIVPYAVFDESAGHFGAVKQLELPDREKYIDCGSGCSQCFELPDGDLLIPVSFREHIGDTVLDAKVAVLRCGFDGTTMQVREIGTALAVENEVRGIGEASVTLYRDRFYLTIRGDTYGYISVSDDGLHYSDPAIWHWDSGCVVPTYNTQSHWLTQDGKLYLVYTRKNGKNDHVFRHRAPLYLAQVDPDRLTLLRDTEDVVIPERGARLGNFGVCSPTDARSFVVAAEWMQPAGCERFGSDNSVWLAEIRR